MLIRARIRTGRLPISFLSSRPTRPSGTLPTFTRRSFFTPGRRSFHHLIPSKWPAPASNFGFYPRLAWHFAKWFIKVAAAMHLFFAYVLSYGLAAGPSMLPTIDIAGTWLVVSRLHRFGRGVRVGDLVHFQVPTHGEHGVKRVLGLPGDYVLVDSPEYGGETMIQVPQGHCWLIGDNLPASRDSRMYGPVPLALVNGKVIMQFVGDEWPRFRWIENPLLTPDVTEH